jgi:hypothetical protein
MLHPPRALCRSDRTPGVRSELPEHTNPSQQNKACTDESKGALLLEVLDRADV